MREWAGMLLPLTLPRVLMPMPWVRVFVCAAGILGIVALIGGHGSTKLLVVHQSEMVLHSAPSSGRGYRRTRANFWVEGLRIAEFAKVTLQPNASSNGVGSAKHP